ncbi:serine acetyltransferase [Oscillochloris sp. ZM17-4]|uniref:serine O-acetyltransferase n=1 Tax=Oscillochloris sp. ZM17-4 TaxID=2866714 RepID=UPI001C73481F|nr:serine acetyltransferase [Oscillochloris sp. ZM17-4]MBX0328838.1 serine acetyltransferase [Oscillochloris sp. ZM17-4]
MFEDFTQDARRWIEPSNINEGAPVSLWLMLRLLFRYMPLRAMAWFRFGCWCKQHRIPYLPGFTQRQIYSRYGLEILVGAEIGGGLYIAHPIGVVVSPKRMGRNCSIIAAVTIGMRNTWDFPQIGDEVFIGAGARVLGAITIGDGAVIGANAVVISDLPAGATAVGIPARITRINGMPVPPQEVSPERIGA